MRKALGRGLEALFPTGSEHGPPPVPSALDIPITDIVPNPDQPRRHFDEEALEDLAASIQLHGILQPLVVRRVAGHWELIAGERRLRAAERAGLDAVPVVVRETRADERLELALIENVQRADLSPLEEAEAYRQLIEEHGLTQEGVAARVGKSRPAVANTLRLLGLPDSVKRRLEDGSLSAGHARAVLAVGDADAQARFAEEVVRQGLTKAETERAASASRPARAERKAPATVGDVHLRALADELTRGLGTRVRLQRRGRGGTIEVEFYSDAQLDALVDRLRTACAARAV
jgi:ParB family transcriptional regulator, chromosome partitioning protein